MVNAEVLDAVRGVPLFEGIDDDSLRYLVSHAEISDVESGFLLTVEDEPGTDVFVILSGSAVVTSEGRELAVVSAPDLIGEMAAFQGDERTATVRATSAMRLLVFDRRSFARLLSEEPAFGARVLAAVRDRMDALLADL